MFGGAMKAVSGAVSSAGGVLGKISGAMGKVGGSLGGSLSKLAGNLGLSKIVANVKPTEIFSKLKEKASSFVSNVMNSKGLNVLKSITGLSNTTSLSGKDGGGMLSGMKSFLFKKASSKMSELTGGVIPRIPSSLDDAKSLFKDVVKKGKEEGKEQWKKLTGLDSLPTSAAGLKSIQDSLLKKASGEISRATGGLIPRIPSSWVDAKKIAKDVAKKGWKEATGLDNPPTSTAGLNELKKHLLEKAGGEISKATGGVIPKIPTSLSEATAMGKEVINTHGRALWNKHTGLQSFPTSEQGLKDMRKELLGKASKEISRVTNGAIPKIPTTIEEAKKTAEEAFPKVWKEATGMGGVPSMKDFQKFRKNLLETERESNVWAGIPKIPKTIDEAKKFAERLVVEQSQKHLEKYTSLDQIPTDPTELVGVLKNLAVAKAGFNVKEMTDGVMDHIPTCITEAESLIAKIGAPKFTELTGMKVPKEWDHKVFRKMIVGIINSAVNSDVKASKP